MNNQTPKTKTQKLWAKKLKDSGFVDIEYPGGTLRSTSPQSFKNKSLIAFETTREYYILAEHFLHEYQFKTELERVIWEYHANGLSVRDISDTLKKVKISKLKRTAVWEILKRLDAELRTRYITK